MHSRGQSQKWTIPEIWTCQREPGSPILPQVADIPSIVPSSEVWQAACLLSCRMPTKTDPKESPSVTAEDSASRRLLIAQGDDALRASVRANQSLGQSAVTIGDINTKNEKVRKIIKVIDEIAPQTKLLAVVRNSAATWPTFTFPSLSSQPTRRR
jgi:hypothetical protein